MASSPAATGEPASAMPFQRAPGSTGAAASAVFGAGIGSAVRGGRATTFSVAGRTGSRAE